MSEEPTGRLNEGESFESRVLEQFALLREGVNSLGTRFSGVEERLADVEGRLRYVEERLTNVEARLSSLETRMSGVETRITSVEGRLSTLEEKVDARLKETRPIWENVLSQLENIDAKLNVLGQDMFDTRGVVERIKKRLPAA
ncbi:MAG TPA: hypothetical protein VF297_19170 [Pyrinomonadaceae bacterium]